MRFEKKISSILKFLTNSTARWIASTAESSAEEKPRFRIVSGSNLSATPRDFNNANVKHTVADFGIMQSENKPKFNLNQVKISEVPKQNFIFKTDHHRSHIWPAPPWHLHIPFAQVKPQLNSHGYS